MATKPRKPKKVDFWYRTGKGIGRLFSGIDGESSTEVRRVENSAKDHILQFMFARDIRELIEDFNLADPEESEDPDTGEIIKSRKTLEELREYAKKKIDLYDLENYVNRYPHWLRLIGQSKIRSSTVAFYASLVAAIRQQIHWTQYNIINVLAKENLTSYETAPYINFWLKELEKNFSKFENVLSDFTDREEKFLQLGFDKVIMENVKTISGACADLYKEFYNHVKGVLNGIPYNSASLRSFRNQFERIDSQLFSEQREIRRYSYNFDIDRETRDRFGLLIAIRNTVNDLFLSKFNFKLLVDDARSLHQISKECSDSDTLVTNLAALGTVIDKISVSEIKHRLKKIPQEGSINALEEFLKENFSDFDAEIVKNLRNIMTIRSQWPIHDNTSKGITLIKDIYGTYPVDDFSVFWSKILDLYTVSMNKLKVLLGT